MTRSVPVTFTRQHQSWWWMDANELCVLVSLIIETHGTTPALRGIATYTQANGQRAQKETPPYPLIARSSFTDFVLTRAAEDQLVEWLSDLMGRPEQYRARATRLLAATITAYRTAALAAS